MHITPEGRVGIGITDPTPALHVLGNANTNNGGGKEVAFWLENRDSTGFSTFRVGENIASTFVTQSLSLVYNNNDFFATGGTILPSFAYLSSGTGVTNGLMLATLADAPLKFAVGFTGYPPIEVGRFASTTGNFLVGTTSSAYKVAVEGSAGVLADHYVALPLKASVLPYASTTVLSASNIYDSALISGNCVQATTGGRLTTTISPCGSGGGSGGGTWATTTSTVSGQLINYPLNTSDIPCIGSTATTSCEMWFDPNTETSYLKGVLGINNTAPNPAYGLDTPSIINAGGFYISGSPIQATQWVNSASDIYYPGAGGGGGTVGIGTTPTGNALEVAGTIGTTDLSASNNLNATNDITAGNAVNAGSVAAGALSIGGTVNFSGIAASTGGDAALCRDAGSNVTWDGSGICTPSSKRYKHDIKELTVQSEKLLMQMNPVSFIYNSGASSTTPQYGFIAEDMAKIDKKLVFFEADGVTPHNILDRGIMAVIVDTVQGIVKKMQAVVARVAGIENRVIKLEKQLANQQKQIDELRKLIKQ